MSDVRIVKPHERDAGTAQTPGMTRVAGVAPSTTGTSNIWMGHVTSAANFASGAHHHGDVESAIYVISGTMRMLWGEKLEHRAEAGAGDFIFVPAQLVHQEINASATEPVVAIVARGGENIVVNVEIPAAN